MQEDCRKLLNETQFVVEATGCEKMLLWEKWCKDSMFKTVLNCYTWEQLPQGYMVAVGKVLEYPVNVTLHWSRINGVLVLFYSPCSRFVDSQLVDQWLARNCAPRLRDRTQLAITDADNFHQVLNYIDDPNRR